MDDTLIGSAGVVAIAGAAVMALLWWLKQRRAARHSSEAAEEERLDTLIGWAPQSTRILRTSERLAFRTLRLALPDHMILAQVPVARFIAVPKRYSYAEWLRRLGSQCVDFVVCDANSQALAVIDVRPAPEQMSDRLQRRLDRVARTLAAVGIPLHVWSEDALPTVEGARAALLRTVGAAGPRVVPGSPGAEGAAALVTARRLFQDTDRNPALGPDIEVIEMTEPLSSTWFDELDSVPSTLPPRTARSSR